MSDFLDVLDSICGHDTATGFVTNQDPAEPLDPRRPHASVCVCASGKCRGYAIDVITRWTGETARYYSYAAIHREVSS